MYSFNNIAGHTRQIRNLKSQLKNKKTGHAYIFDGERGCGKKTLAYAFAKALLCQNGDGACGCKACVTFESGNNPDIIKLRLEKTKTIGVEEIRETINASVFIKPYLYQKKVYVIEDAAAMTAQAQNALLKTLEEAPGYCVFMLICDNAGLMLPTILSRCALIKLRPLRSGELESYIMNKLGLSGADAGLYAAVSGGNTGRALELAVSEDFRVMRGFVVNELLHGLDKKDLISLFGLAKRLEEYKSDITSVFEIMLLWYRDLAVCKELGSFSAAAQKDLAGLYRQNTDSTAELLRKAGVIADTKLALSRNVNFQLAMEVMLMKLSRKGVL